MKPGVPEEERPGSIREVPRHVDVQAVPMPTLVYGTAWKEERTADLVRHALSLGFRGIDTANQRRHYHEAAVGEALRGALEQGDVRREDVFLQTKFTYVASQDHRLPYEAHAAVADQVAQSAASSLEHLGVDRLDALLLHGPSTHEGLAAADRDAWRAMEVLVAEGAVRIVGVSNVTVQQLREIWEAAEVKPTVVQNRCFTRPRADRDVRAFCREKGIAYQGFSLLTAHGGAHLAHPLVQAIAARVSRTPAEVILRYCLEQGMVVLTGTTSPEHMAQDIGLYRFHLDAADLEQVQKLLG